MKKHIYILVLIFFSLCRASYGQNDSLNGFDEKQIINALANKHVIGWEAENYVNQQRLEFKINKYPSLKTRYSSLSVSSQISGAQANKGGSGNGNSVEALSPCTNMDFEAGFPGVFSGSNNVSGWTVSSQTIASCGTPTVWNPGSTEFSVHTTPLSGVPLIGTLQQSPLGGSKIVQLNNFTANQYCTMLSRTLNVSSGSTVFQFAYATVLQDGYHNCCEQSHFKVQFRNCQGVLVPCLTFSFNATPAMAPAMGGCYNLPVNNYSQVNYSTSCTWTNWRVKNIDLSQYIGSCLQVEVIASDCIFSGHYGTIFFDAICNPGPSSPFISGLNNGGNISFCPGTATAVITAPSGYEAYQWYPAYPTVQNTLSTLTTTFIGQSTYTVVYHNGNPSCAQSQTYAVIPSTVNVTGIGVNSSCSLTAGGSATVQVTGSNLGYNYSWINSTNSVVGTSSAVANLAPGNYSVIVTVPNSSACGSVVAGATINLSPPQTNYFLKPYCSAQVYFYPVSGSNFQWYNGSVPISSGQGGTAPGYTISSPVNNSYYTLSYLNSQGCKDSTIYNVVSSLPGTISFAATPSLCPNLASTVVLNINSAVFSPTVSNSFTVLSINNTPSYSYSSGLIIGSTYTLNTLLAGYSYSINAFDGSCYINSVIAIPSVIPPVNYTLNPSSPSFCSGSSVLVILSCTSSPYPISWTPTTGIQFVNNYNGTFSATLTPTVALGSSSTLIYTVSITENPSNCVFNLNLPVTVSNFATPTISPVAPLCSNSGTYAIIAQPSGGIFISQSTNSITPVISSNGIITTSAAPIGSTHFLYLLAAPGCSVSSSGSFLVNVPPTITINQQSILCLGETATLTALGANTFTWNTGVTGSTNLVSPATTTSYTVIGTNTLNLCNNTQSVTVQINPCTAIEEVGLSSTMKLYPNPASGEVILVTGTPGTLYIYNSLGQLILEKMMATTKEVLNISGFMQGMYIVKIGTRERTEIFTLIKN